jgi:hypothetical protein
MGPASSSRAHQVKPAVTAPAPTSLAILATVEVVAIYVIPGKHVLMGPAVSLATVLVRTPIVTPITVEVVALFVVGVKYV